MIILASNSPRRKELLGGLDMEFRTWVILGIDESYPSTMKAEVVPEYIAQKKTIPYFNDENIGEFTDEDIILTADTVVILNGEVLGKPKDEKDACLMLRKLSGRTHHVITGVCLRTKAKMRHFSVKTDVTFANLTDEQIEYYVSNYHPLDKAGSYGVQEWIGYIGVTKLEGSYFNVMGLPVQRIYEELKIF
ncbi:septum formation protein Maf [Palleniella muris]|uniref:Septum formation protein Maf n=1 Tax=Palleniella muris TaxID=3038145 RepID=A0AC61QT36_9BACT|nr:Maf family nucleotide pyrophosphatase [Palleniella muris]TGX83613.1 septum formation protein Maf [Palleniella muris]